MDRKPSKWLLVIGAVLVIAAASLYLLGGAGRANATDTRGGCASAHTDLFGDKARACRGKGWLVSANYVVSPAKVLRYYDLPRCRFEDGSGQRAACGWNVVEGDRNGHGRVYLSITHRIGQDDVRVYLNQRIDGHLVPWRR